MYFAIVGALMFLLPAGSMLAEVLGAGAPFTPLLVCKWYVFWAVGLRLFLAGVRQVAQPAYTAHQILGLKGEEPLVVVRELGFANLAFGALGLASIAVPSWRLAGAFAGGIFYGLAGIQHIVQRHRNPLENVAMGTDLFAAAVLLGACAGVLMAS